MAHGDYSPVGLVAAVLRTLAASAGAYLGEPVEEAVLAVPNHYGMRERQALKDAGAIAGLKVQRVLSATSAAALALGSDSGRRRVGVYDLGGGNFNVSILEIQDGVYAVLSSGGEPRGGEDIDRLIVNRLVERFQATQGIELGALPRSLHALKQAAEKAKIELSTRERVDVTVADAASGPRHLEAELTRTELEGMVEPLLERAVRVCQGALDDAEITVQDIDDVIAVGGQTRTPKVQEALRRFFGKELDHRANPFEAVVEGAAIHTGILRIEG